MTGSPRLWQKQKKKRPAGLLLICVFLLALAFTGCGSSKKTDSQPSGDETEATEAYMSSEEKLQAKQDEAMKFLDQVVDWYNGQDAKSLAQHISAGALAASKRSVEDQQEIYEKEFEKDKICLVKKDYFQIQDLEVWGLRTYYTYDGVDKELALVAFEENGDWVYCNYQGFKADYLK